MSLVAGLELAVALSLGLAGATPAIDPCESAGLSAECIADHARQLLADVEPRAAANYLKQHRERFEESPQLLFLLVRAYLDLDNKVWARRTLTQRLDAHPDDCLARAWLVWVSAAAARFDAAREVLARSGCPKTALERTRWSLLEAFIAREEGRHEAARQHTEAGRDSEVMFPEDAALMNDLERSLWPRRGPPIRFSADLRGGWTSNPLLGSPLDPTAGEGDFNSGFGELRLWARIGTPFYDFVQPQLEVDLRGLLFGASAADELSYLTLGAAPGLAWDAGDVLVRTLYRFDAVLMAGGDAYEAGPLWFYEAHRAEVKLEVGPYLTFFVGGGWRAFRELGRTRAELDLGLGGGGEVGAGVLLLGAASARMHRATNQKYNLWGATLLVSADIPLGLGFTASVFASIAVDGYVDSKGSFSVEARDDSFVKGRLAVWSPRLPLSLRIGVAYEPSHRQSTSPQYTFTDHKLLVHLRMSMSWDPYRPDTQRPADHMPLEYGLGDGGAGLGDRLQELLRQDEEAQRGSSCLNR